MVATRRKNYADIKTSGVSDPVARTAMRKIAEFIKKTVSQGLYTAGTVLCDRLSTSSGNEFQVMIRTDTLDASAEVSYTVPGQILGVCGYTEHLGIDGWGVMVTASSSGCRFQITAGDKYNYVKVKNGSGTYANQFYIVIFYDDRNTQ